MGVRVGGECRRGTRWEKGGGGGGRRREGIKHEEELGEGKSGVKWKKLSEEGDEE